MRKVQIARILLDSPEILILDEPFDGLVESSRIADGIAAHMILIGVQLLALLTQSFFVLNVALVFSWIAFAFVVIREHRRLSEMRG